jgi:hypothetical protein
VTGPAEGEAGARPLPAEREAQKRAACITLADLALRLAGGDRALAKGMLREALEAIGAVPYERTPPPYFYGREPS